MWRPNLRGRADEYVVRALDTLYNALGLLQTEVKKLQRSVENTSVNMPGVRKELQAGGLTPLNVEGLLGHLSQNQPALSKDAWALPTGTLTRTTFDTTTVTLPQLAERVAAMITDQRTST